MSERKSDENRKVGWISPPKGLFNLRSAADVTFLRLARSEPAIQRFLHGLYREAAKWDKLPKGWTDESVKKFWDTMTGDVKHKVTKCMKEMDGKVTDTGAFCASLADKVEGTAWRHEKRTASVKRVADRYLRHKLALKVEPLPAYQGEKIQQAIEYHLREADDSSEMADDIEKAWGKWDFRTLGSYQVLSPRDVQNIRSMKMPPGRDDEKYLGEIGAIIKEHILGLRRVALDHRKEAQLIDKAWKNRDLRRLRQMRVL